MDVVVRFVGDSAALEKSVAGIDKKVGGLSSGFKKLGGVVAGAFAVREVADFVDAAQEANRVSAALEKTFANAGDATGEWARHAEDLADALQRRTGIDDEAIKQGQIFLSTSKALADTLSTQPDLFDRSTKAMLDLARSGFGDVDTAAKGLLKAFEGGEQGLGGLRRAGIFFTDDQKKVIQAFIDSGDTASAFNEILKTVEAKVGGVAETTATSSDKMKVAWDETKEAIGNALLPVLEAAVPKLEAMAKFMQDNADKIVPLVGGVAGLAAALKGFNIVLGVTNGLIAAFGIETGLATGWIAIVVVAVAGLVAWTAVLYAKWDEVWSFIGGLPWYAKVAAAVLLISNPIVVITTAIAALGVYWDQIWGRISAVAGAAQVFIVEKLAAIGSAVRGIHDAIQRFLGPVWDFLLKYLVGPIIAAANAVESAVDRIVAAVKRVKDVIGKGISVGLGPLGGLTDVPTLLKGIPGLAAGGIVTSPTLAVVGEAGTEAVLPLDQLGRFGGAPLVVNVYATGLGADSPAIQAAVVDALRQHTNRSGPLAASITGR